VHELNITRKAGGVERGNGGAGAGAVQVCAHPHQKKPKKLKRDFLKMTPHHKKEICFPLGL